VVVAAGLETADPVVDRAPGAQDQHGRGDAARAHRFDQREAVALRQHHVDDRDVVRLDARKVEAGVAVARVIHGKPRLAQPPGHELGDGRVVFDEQRPHVYGLAQARTRGTCGASRRPRQRCAVPGAAARTYWGGHLISRPSSRAARSGKYGSRSSSRASSTRSACPCSTIALACADPVIRPTAPVAMAASRLTRSANGTWYPGPTAI